MVHGLGPKRLSWDGHPGPSLPSAALSTYPVDEHVFGQSCWGVLDATEAVHHLLVLKVTGEFLQAPICRSSESEDTPMPPLIPSHILQTPEGPIVLDSHPKQQEGPERENSR